MATLSEQYAVKSLNTAGGKRQFAYKTFWTKIEEISDNIKVYQSLDRVKEDPSGSSFFLDCLNEYRVEDTTEGFISFYDEMFPFVQTLPEVLNSKEKILSELISRLDMKWRLSIGSILSLIVALSRDVLGDFINIPTKVSSSDHSSYLQWVAESLVLLLSSGADREPEIIEQIFTSWSYIMMYLQKHVIKRVVYVLEVTESLRFYPKEYIQESSAQSISFVLRTAPDDQLESGVRKVMSEDVDEPSETRKYGVSALLSYVMIGSSSKLHSKAKRILHTGW